MLDGCDWLGETVVGFIGFLSSQSHDLVGKNGLPKS